MASNGSWPKGGSFDEGNDVFFDTSIPEDMDDEAILAMCDDDISPEPSSAMYSSATSVNPFNFGMGMEGSTININNSQDIHFGPKTMATPSTVPVLNSSCSTPAMSHSGRVSHPERSESVDEVESISSLCSHFPEGLNLRTSKGSEASQSIFESRRFSEAISERVPPPLIVNIPGQASTVTSISGHRPLTDTRIRKQSEGDPRGCTALRKAASQPIGDGRSRSPSASSYISNSCHKQELQTIPQFNALSPNLPQMSAAINNSENVHMGTQIVYNYHYTISPDSDQHPPPNRVTAPEEPKDFLIEFKDKLISVYQKRTKSSLLPWHRGKQLIPISEYYTEPQIYEIDQCGNRRAEAVNIINVLNSSNETRFLVEGEAGMGKTLLATKLAEEWAKGHHRLQQFKILILVNLGDFKGSLEQYVREELLPSYFDSEKFEKVWEFCKTHDKEILFVLDGFDELQRRLDKGEIHNLLKSKDFPESKVVVTSRPNVLKVFEKKIEVSGFGQLQIMEFIEKYFRAIGNVSSGQSLRKIIEKDDKYWKLAKRPLFCVLLCMLYITGEVGESLPDRQSDIMLQIILCLIKWNLKNDGNSAIDFDSLPQEYEKPFHNFGKLCLNTLKTEKSRFTDQEVHSIEGFDTKLQQLGFLYNDNESHALGERKFWKPVHQTFLEYLGAFYMARHIRDCKGSCKECKNYNVVFQRSPEVLKFCVGILNCKAYRLLDGQRYPALWELSVTKILQLLKEAEPKPENCHAVAKLLDQQTVEISTSEIEFEGWSYILSQPFRRLNNLRIAWRIKSTSPDQESSFTEASQTQYSNFFEALKNNESIRSIHVRAKQDGEKFTDEKIEMFFSHFKNALLKKNLQELQIVEMKLKASGYLKSALESVLKRSNKLKALQDLRVLKIHTFMEDKDLMGICDTLQKCAPGLESLHLDGLKHGNSGFQSLVNLLKGNGNIRFLHLSMDQSELVDVLGSQTAVNNNYAPNEMRKEIQKMNTNARKKSRSAFNEQSNSNVNSSPNLSNGDVRSGNTRMLTVAERDVSGRVSPIPSHSPTSGREVDPRKELHYLFDKLPLTNGVWSIEARHHWYLRKASCDLRIPLPICVGGEHKSVFHFLFSALPETQVKSLTLSQPGLYLTTSDMICLGNAVRKSNHLSILNVQGLDKVESYLPLLIGIGQSPALTNVNISSSKVILNDSAFEVVCTALQNNTTLRSLLMSRWQFHLQNTKEAQKHVSDLFSRWQITHLDLKQCCVVLGDHSVGPSSPSTPTNALLNPLSAFFTSPIDVSLQPWRQLKNISLEGMEIKEQSGLVRRGHLLLPGLINFVNLTSLDLSVSPAKALQVDNMALRRFFGIIGSDMKQLTELKLSNWEFCLRYTKENDLASCLRACRRLKKIQLEKVNEVVDEYSTNKSDSSAVSGCKLTFLHQLVSYVPNLENLSLCCYRINKHIIDQDMASRIGICLHDHFHNMPFTVKFFNLSSEVDNIFYQTLKKPPCRVKRSTSSSPSLIVAYEVRCILNLMKRPYN